MAETRDASSATPALAVRELAVEAAGCPLLRGVSFTLAPGRVLALLGPSGAGKTTLLRCLNRLLALEPELEVRGEIRVGGVATTELDVDRLRARVGMLFQQPVIFPGSIAHNARFGLRFAREVGRDERRRRIERAFRDAALWDEVRDRLDTPAATLSVGQQQRLCLARLLALEPEVILMDEPTGNLDPTSTRAIEELIARLKNRRAIVLVTHDPAQALRVADDLGLVTRRPGADGVEAGELVAWGPVVEVREHPEVAAYLDGHVPGPVSGDPTW